MKSRLWAGLDNKNARTARPTFIDHRALCVKNPEIFFPEDDPKKRPAWEQAAKAACRRCPLGEDCLEWALETRQPHGVWGAATPRERNKVLKERAAAGELVAS